MSDAQGMTVASQSMPAWDLDPSGKQSQFRIWFRVKVSALGVAVYTVGPADKMIQIFDTPLHETSQLLANAASGAPKVSLTSFANKTQPRFLLTKA